MGCNVGKEKITDKILNFIYGTVYFTGIIMVFCSFGLPCYQIYMYFRHGFWKSYSITWLIFEIFPDISPKFIHWLTNPTDWLGAHKILVFIFNLIPISGILFFLGLGIVIIVPEEYSKKIT